MLLLTLHADSAFVTVSPQVFALEPRQVLYPLPLVRVVSSFILLCRVREFSFNLLLPSLPRLSLRYDHMLSCAAFLSWQAQPVIVEPVATVTPAKVTISLMFSNVHVD